MESGNNFILLIPLQENVSITAKIYEEMENLHGVYNEITRSPKFVVNSM